MWAHTMYGLHIRLCVLSWCPLSCYALTYVYDATPLFREGSADLHFILGMIVVTFAAARCFQVKGVDWRHGFLKIAKFSGLLST
jgi:hypothetical protein